MANYKKKQPTPRTFYDIEVSQPTYDAILDAARIMAQIIRGDLSAVVQAALNAYRERTGEPAPADIEHNIRECARGLSTWGWNRPFTPAPDTEAVKVYDDLNRVLMMQREILNGLDLSYDYELQHDSAAPLPRIRCAYQSTQERIKQLRIFTPEITNKKPR